MKRLILIASLTLRSAANLHAQDLDWDRFNKETVYYNECFAHDQKACSALQRMQSEDDRRFSYAEKLNEGWMYDRKVRDGVQARERERSNAEYYNQLRQNANSWYLDAQDRAKRGDYDGAARSMSAYQSWAARAEEYRPR
jgi:hypothetical protein